MRRFLFTSFILFIYIFMSYAQSTNICKEPVLSGETASRIATKAFDEANRRGFFITVTVVDKSGQILSVIRHHNAGVHTLQASYKKAYTACSQKRETGEIRKGIIEGSIPEDIRFLDNNFSVMDGGVPITIEGIVVGGIGVGGAHGNEDTEIAKTAIDKLL
ncbi:MAG: heme-binding protein [Parabacteroides sp.]|nr:heme-binding protein [Parabacteroides sp.]